MILSPLSWLYLIAGQFFYFRGKTDRALPLLKKSIPSSGGYLYYGLAHAAKGQYETAWEMIGKEKERSSEPEVLSLFQAILLYDWGKYEDCEKILQEEVLSKNPQHWLAQSYCALASAQKKGEVGPLKELQKRGLCPDGLFQAKLYAFCMELNCKGASYPLEKLELLRETYIKTLQPSSKDPEGFIAECEDNLMERKYEPALIMAQKAVESDPASPEAHLYLAYSYWKNNRLEESKKHILQRQRIAFYQSLGDFEGILTLALQIHLALRMGKIAVAVKAYCILEALSSQEWEAKLARGEVLCALQKKEEGWKILAGLYSEDPEEFTQRLKETLHSLPSGSAHGTD